MDFHDVLKAGYSNSPTTQIRFAEKNGYVRDAELSNKKHQVYTNNAGHLVYNVNGTQSLGDWGTNSMLATGQGRNSERYAREKASFERARQKHRPTSVSVTVSSLGGYLASNIAEIGDRVSTYNAAYTSPKQVGSNNHYRAVLDPVSVLSVGTKHTKNLYAPPSLTTALLGSPAGLALEQHSVKNLKGKKIPI
jgi:hypothetical protein